MKPYFSWSIQSTSKKMEIHLIVFLISTCLISGVMNILTSKAIG